MKMLKSKAFTTLELILVITIMATLSGFFLLYNQGASVRTDLQTQVALFVADLRLLQSDAESGKNPGTFGMHLSSNSYTIFEGAVYDSASTSNRAVELPDTIIIQNINLNGAGTDIIFNSPRGETSQNGSLEFYSVPLNETKTITISTLGYASY